LHPIIFNEIVLTARMSIKKGEKKRKKKDKRKILCFKNALLKNNIIYKNH